MKILNMKLIFVKDDSILNKEEEAHSLLLRLMKY